MVVDDGTHRVRNYSTLAQPSAETTDPACMSTWSRSGHWGPTMDDWAEILKYHRAGPRTGVLPSCTARRGKRLGDHKALDQPAHPTPASLSQTLAIRRPRPSQRLDHPAEMRALVREHTPPRSSRSAATTKRYKPGNSAAEPSPLKRCGNTCPPVCSVRIASSLHVRQGKGLLDSEEVDVIVAEYLLEVDYTWLSRSIASSQELTAA
jgi:hypothetical protein